MASEDDKEDCEDEEDDDVAVAGAQTACTSDESTEKSLNGLCTALLSGKLPTFVQGTIARLIQTHTKRDSQQAKKLEGGKRGAPTGETRVGGKSGTPRKETPAKGKSETPRKEAPEKDKSETSRSENREDGKERR